MLPGEGLQGQRMLAHRRSLWSTCYRGRDSKDGPCTTKIGIVCPARPTSSSWNIWDGCCLGMVFSSRTNDTNNVASGKKRVFKQIGNTTPRSYGTTALSGGLLGAVVRRLPSLVLTHNKERVHLTWGGSGSQFLQFCLTNWEKNKRLSWNLIYFALRKCGKLRDLGMISCVPGTKL